MKSISSFAVLKGEAAGTTNTLGVDTSTEIGASHLELNLAHRPALEAADAAVLYKHALRELAAAEDLTVTFMARPEVTLAPSSSHVHVSLWDGARNAFWIDKTADLRHVPPCRRSTRTDASSPIAAAPRTPPGAPRTAPPRCA